MRRARQILIATGLAALTASSGGAVVPGVTGSVRVAASRPAGLTAHVISTRPIFREDPETKVRTPAITSGSGIAQAGWWLFAAQDDSALVAVKGLDGSLESIRVFPSVEGADRFGDIFGNKKLKPDLESALTVPVAAPYAAKFGAPRPDSRLGAEAVMLIGSGSKQVLRDRIALIFPAERLADSHVVAVYARGLYERLRHEPAITGAGGELNIEGVALVRSRRYVRFYNRGNGAKGSVAGSVDVPLDELLAYLARAKDSSDARFDVPLSERRIYDFGRSTGGETIGITDAITVPPLDGAPRGLAGEIHIVSLIAERTATATGDGSTSDTSIGLELPDGRLITAPMTGPDGLDDLKIEGLLLVSAEWVGQPAELHVNLLGVTDSDAVDPNTPSTLARIEVTFQTGRRARAR